MVRCKDVTKPAQHNEVSQNHQGTQLDKRKGADASTLQFSIAAKGDRALEDPCER
jgi:hypothetical protein